MSTQVSGPDPTKAAEMQAQSSKENTNTQTWANRPNQETPWGSTSWTNEATTDPATGQKVARWTEHTTLDPRLQGALDSQINAQAGRSQMAEDLLGQTRNSLLKPLQSWDGTAGADAMYGQMASRLDPQWDRQEQTLRTRAANQGLTPGTEAYDNLFANFGRDRNDAYNTANRTATMYGNQYAQGQQALELGDRTASLNLMNAALNGQQVSMPQMPGFSQAAQADPTQYLQASEQNAQRAQQQNQMWGDIVGGAAGLGSSLMMFSDERLKRNIKRSGMEVLGGVPWATWEWLDGTPGEGVIAQDLERVRPDLVKTLGGFKMVDYGGLAACL